MIWNLVSSSRPGNQHSGFGFIAALSIILAGLFAGVLATTGNPMILGLGIGVIVGALLLSRLDLVILIVLIGTLAINGMIGLAYPAMLKASWIFSVFGFYLLIASLVKVYPELQRRQTQLGPVLFSLLAVLLFVFLAFPASSGTIPEFLAGFKRAFQMVGVAFAVALLPLNETTKKQISRFLKVIFGIALIQLPLALYERIALVPLREGMWRQGVVPIDVVAGSFEASLTGGGLSSVMAIYCLTVLTYLIALLREHHISAGTFTIAAIWIAAPLFLGETKIVMLLLPLAVIISVFPIIRHRPFLALSGLVGLAGSMAGLFWVYFGVFASGNATAEEQLIKAIAYNFGAEGYFDRYSLNRITALSFWFTEHTMHNPLETVIGHGTGASYAGSGALVPGHLNKLYAFMAINLTSLSTLLWDIGIAGTVIYLAPFLFAWRALSTTDTPTASAQEMAIKSALRFSLIANIITLIYSNSAVSALSHQTIIAFTLGYIVWLSRNSKAKQLKSAT